MYHHLSGEHFSKQWVQIIDSLPDAGLTGVDWAVEDKPPVWFGLPADQPDGTTQVHFSTPSVLILYVFPMRKGVIDTSEGGYLYLSAVVVDHSRGFLSVTDAGSVFLSYASC